MRRLTLPGAIFLSLIAFYLLVAGIQQFVIEGRYRTPQSITYEDFVRRHPSQGWYEITNANVWFTEYRGRIGVGKLSILPLRGVAQPASTTPVEIFFKPKSPAILSTMDTLDPMTPAERAAYLTAHQDKIDLRTTVVAGIMPSLDPSVLNLKFAEAAYGNQIDPGHTVLMTEGDGPNSIRGSLLAVSAFVLVFLTYRWYVWSIDPYREERMRLVMDNAVDPVEPVESERNAQIRKVLESSGVPAEKIKGEKPWWEKGD